MFSAKLVTKFKYFSIILCGIAVGVASTFLIQKKYPSTHRSVASIESGYKPQRLVLGKHAAAMSIEILGPETYPSNKSEIVELVGFITQNIESDTWLDYIWSLPPGVTLVQGQITGSLENRSLGTPSRISILVSGFTNESQKLISLSSRLEKANNPLTASAVIVSRPEDTPETRVMNLQALAAEKAKEE